MRLADPPRDYRTKEFAYNNKELEREIERLAQPAGTGYSVSNYADTRTLDVSALPADAQDLGNFVATLAELLRVKGIIG